MAKFLRGREIEISNIGLCNPLWQEASTSTTQERLREGETGQLCERGRKGGKVGMWTSVRTGCKLLFIY